MQEAGNKLHWMQSSGPDYLDQLVSASLDGVTGASSGNTTYLSGLGTNSLVFRYITPAGVLDTGCIKTG
jgi:hypothetical protein